MHNRVCYVICEICFFDQLREYRLHATNAVTMHDVDTNTVSANLAIKRQAQIYENCQYRKISECCYYVQARRAKSVLIKFNLPTSVVILTCDPPQRAYL